MQGKWLYCQPVSDLHLPFAVIIPSLVQAPTRYGCDQTPDHCGFQDVRMLQSCECTFLIVQGLKSSASASLFRNRTTTLLFGALPVCRTAPGKLWQMLSGVSDPPVLFTDRKCCLTSTPRDPVLDAGSEAAVLMPFFALTTFSSRAYNYYVLWWNCTLFFSRSVEIECPKNVFSRNHT